jgi:hypothetical protein
VTDFLRVGYKAAFLKDDGTWLVSKDELTMSVTIGRITSMWEESTLAGIGSSTHDFNLVFFRISDNSSVVVQVNSSKQQVSWVIQVGKKRVFPDDRVFIRVSYGGID